MSVIPKIDFYVQNKMNVILVGDHGVGKTYGLLEAAGKHGLKVKYYSCATLDPFTDLVGVPYPTEDGKELNMIRPRAIDEADIVFFDELNRAADTKTLNAILEIVQFHSINGERLPNLKAVWAAINPIEKEEYEVRSLDPALLDRFDVFVEIKPKVSVPYLRQFMDEKIAQAIADWWKQRSGGKADYISPRRMEKIGRIVHETGDTAVVKQMMPLGGKYDVGALIQRLNVATGKVSADELNNNKMGGPPDDSIITEKKWLKNNKKEVKKRLEAGNVTESTIDNIVKALENGIAGERMVTEYIDVLDALPVVKLEGMVNGWNPSKKSLARTKIRNFRNGKHKNGAFAKALG